MDTVWGIQGILEDIRYLIENISLKKKNKMFIYISFVRLFLIRTPNLNMYIGFFNTDWLTYIPLCMFVSLGSKMITELFKF